MGGIKKTLIEKEWSYRNKGGRELDYGGKKIGNEKGCNFFPIEGRKAGGKIQLGGA